MILRRHRSSPRRRSWSSRATAWSPFRSPLSRGSRRSLSWQSSRATPASPGYPYVAQENQRLGLPSRTKAVVRSSRSRAPAFMHEAPRTRACVGPRLDASRPWRLLACERAESFARALGKPGPVVRGTEEAPLLRVLVVGGIDSDQRVWWSRRMESGVVSGQTAAGGSGCSQVCRIQ